ncbi:MAG: hypothetical protein B6I38_11915 [Anaerolineaceae bacterium 4572_5.1]|nr:MAG: hypothetical protein B6I38_11915 [Anaerolineaceae bacterium 4572_5.1]
MDSPSLSEISQDIHAMDEELWHYEARYGIRSQYFFELYKSGQLNDEDPTEARDYTDWAACYEIKRHRVELYDSIIRNMLPKIKMQVPISLAALKFIQTDYATLRS